MQTPAILYTSPRLRGAMTEQQADALSFYDCAIRTLQVSLQLPPRIAENRVDGVQIVPAWMIGAARVNNPNLGA